MKHKGTEKHAKRFAKDYIEAHKKTCTCLQTARARNLERVLASSGKSRTSHDDSPARKPYQECERIPSN